MVAPILSLQFDTGQLFTIFGFIAVAIGGMGSFIGAVVGGLVLGVAEQLAAGYVSVAVQQRAGSLPAAGDAAVAAERAVRPGPHAAHRRARASSASTRRSCGCAGAARRCGSACARGGAAAPCRCVVADPALIELPGRSPRILFIAVLGLDVLMGYRRPGQPRAGGFMAIGGYVAAILATDYDWPPLVGIAARLCRLADLRAAAVARDDAAARPLSRARHAGLRSGRRLA